MDAFVKQRRSGARVAGGGAALRGEQASRGSAQCLRRLSPTARSIGRPRPSNYAGHSLRAGLATAAAAAGVSERSIMEQTGHKSEAMVRRYIRRGSLFSDNAAGKVGL